MDPPRTPEKPIRRLEALTPNTKTLVEKTLENDAMRKKVTSVVNDRISKAKENLNVKVKDSIAKYNDEVNRLKDDLLITIGSKIVEEPDITRSIF
jgi:hypothetical protein